MAKDFDSSKFLVPAIIAVIGDVGTFFGLLFGIIISFTGVLLPMGLMLIIGSVFWHYATGVMVLFMAWSNLPKNSLLQKIVVVMNPRFWLVLTFALPLPLLSLGVALAVILQNKIAQMAVEQALILGLAAATGGAGLAAEGAAVGGEVAAEGAAVAAEGTAAATEAGAAAAEAGSEAAEETLGQAAKRKGKEFVKKKVKERLEEGGEEEEEEPGTPEDQELEDIMSGDPFGRHVMRAMSAEDILATIGGEEASSRFNPEKMGPEMEIKKNPSGTAQGGRGIINGKEVDLRNQKNRELL